ncbi:2OG-Fe(II) oxygenase [Chondrinema litorale]|uniref:2OG-Fe(II) oxygenase n=1 Tax=Chondrinema litorale TaxID=2994555 RepID=UPI0025430AEA|nr:2OG-Fe(II) oxygenase [Chondrinema litorale]UZR98815.1 2OG-Fe(II) oxygenase [Chondrinema litorale]
MENIEDKIAQANWAQITKQLSQKGFATLPKLLTDEQCEALKADYHHPDLYRKQVIMERYRFGLGEYKYYQYPLPNLIQQIRQNVYPYLVPVANQWMSMLNIEKRFPATLEELHVMCRAQKQLKPTALILKYAKGGFNTLHQDLYGEVFFPIQVVMVLSEPEQDFMGGEFVLTEQVPRAQSKAIVLKPKKGDMLIFTTNFRPVKGARGYYRVNMKHGVSEVQEGERFTLGVIFHDALS